MKPYMIATLFVLAAGCVQESAQRSTVDEEQVAQPASSTIPPAEATGYINATDPQTYPQTPGDSTSR